MSKPQLSVWIVGIGVLGLLFMASAIQGAQVVVPVGLEDVEGNTNNASPFDCLVFDPSQRYQQVYLGSEVGSGEIVELQFRQDGVFGDPFDPVTIPATVIQMSSTTADPFGLLGGLSVVFADNVGIDVVTVLDGDLELSSVAIGGVPRPFDIVVRLATPFVFDASTGLNLLLDVTFPQCVLTTTMDMEGEMDDSVSRALSEDHTSPTAKVTDTGGLVTRIVFAEIFSDGFESGDTTAW